MFLLAESWHPSTFSEFLGAALVWIFVGIIAMLGGFLAFDKLVHHRYDTQDELKKGNNAVAIVVAGFLIAAAIVVHAAIS